MKSINREGFFNFLHYTIGLVIILCLLSIPGPAGPGVAFRNDFSTIAISVFLLYLIFSLFPGILKNTLLFGFICFLFVIPVVGLWASGQSEQYLIGGIIPFSDARFYYMDARRLLEGSLFATGAARRPLFAALLTSFQWLTGQNLYISIGLLIVLLSLATYFVVREIHSCENPLAAGFFLLLIFFYIRFLLGKTMSEMIGLPLGLLAFFFLYRSAKQLRTSLFLIGLFLLTLALNARAGAFFILPMLGLWGGFAFRQTKKFNWSVVLLAVLIIAGGFAVNFLVFSVLSSPDNTPFGNFSSTLYGLSRGGQSWTLIFEEHPEVAMMPADKSVSFIYQLAFENIRTNPGELVKGILNSYATFFSLDDYYGSLCWFGGSNTIGIISKIGLYALMAAGMITSILKVKDASRSLLLAAFIGIVLSITLVPPRDSNRMRVYAATFPFFASLPVIGLSYLYSLIPLKRKLFSDTRPIALLFPMILSSLIVVLTTVVPFGLRFASRPSVLPSSNCLVGMTNLSFRLLPGNHFTIHDQGSIKQDWLPDLQKDNFSRLAHDLPNWELFPILTGIDQGQMLISDLNLNDMKEMILIIEKDKVKPGTEIQSICGTYQTDPNLKIYDVYLAN